MTDVKRNACCVGVTASARYSTMRAYCHTRRARVACIGHRTVISAFDPAQRGLLRFPRHAGIHRAGNAAAALAMARQPRRAAVVRRTARRRPIIILAIASRRARKNAQRTGTGRTECSERAAG